MNTWTKEHIDESPFSFILRLSEKEYMDNINKVRAKYQENKIDNRYQLL